MSQELLLLGVRCVDALLHDAATVHVTGDQSTIHDHGIVDELLVRW